MEANGLTFFFLKKGSFIYLMFFINWCFTLNIEICVYKNIIVQYTQAIEHVTHGDLKRAI